MELIEIFKTEYLSIIFGGAAGVITAWLTQRVLNKRGVFRYYVNHNRIGMSTEDQIFGNVQVTWNNEPIRDLYLSTIEMKNESLNDYENVKVKTYTSNTDLLTEQTRILNTPEILTWTEKYKESVTLKQDEEITDIKRNIYFGGREYNIPIFNRGQSIRITYLNSARNNEVPYIWLSVQKKGVKVKFSVPQNEIFEVPQPHAAFAGVLIGLIGIIPLIIFVTNSWIIGFSAFIYGLVAQIPGAFSIRLIKRFREYVGG